MAALRRDGFSPVTLADRPQIQPLLLAEDLCFCEYNFANLFAWGEIYQTRWQLADGLLWLYNGHDDLLLMPVGRPLRPEELLAASDALRREGGSGDIVLVDPDFLAVHSQLRRHFDAREDPDNGDYIYRVQKLVDLAGNKLHKKRNLVSQFRDRHPDYAALPLQGGDLGSCLELAKKWCRLRTCDQLDFTHETSALRRMLLHFAELELQGIKITLHGRLAAFSVYSRLNSNMADVHFEKFDPEVKGAGQVINWETAKALAAGYTYVNREQDLGLEGLRQAKRSYEPEYVLNPLLLKRRR